MATVRTASKARRPAGARPPASDEELLFELLAGREQAFCELVGRHHRAMVGVAAMYVPSSVAEEVVQETWLAVLQGVHRFEGRSSLKTWIFRILVNQARSRGVREKRSTPVSSLTAARDEDGAAVGADRFLEEGHRWAGHWVEPPKPWTDVPAEQLMGAETRAVAEQAMEALPVRQREVIRLRDVEGWSSDEVCEALGISAVNQRVLLHRARSRVRAELDRHLAAARA